MEGMEDGEAKDLARSLMKQKGFMKKATACLKKMNDVIDAKNGTLLKTKVFAKKIGKSLVISGLFAHLMVCFIHLTNPTPFLKSKLNKIKTKSFEIKQNQLNFMKPNYDHSEYIMY